MEKFKITYVGAPSARLFVIDEFINYQDAYDSCVTNNKYNVQDVSTINIKQMNNEKILTNIINAILIML